MSWYYVGPDAQPVGPISLEELQSRRAAGAVAPETYVIEAPPGSAPKEWLRYREVFPAKAQPLPPGLPPLPTAGSPPPVPTMGIPYPVLPAPVPATPSPGGPVFTGAHPSTYRLPPSHNNPWCVWGFGLGIASLPCLLCLIGLLLAIMVDLHQPDDAADERRRCEQHGRGLAIAGLIASVMALFLGAIVFAAALSSSWHSVVSMTTEQTSNDSDTR
jgi:hypothetical protein